MSIQNITKSIVVSTVLAIAPTTYAWAGADGVSIVEGWLDAAKGYEFIKVTHNGVVYDDTNNVTTVNDLSIQLEFGGAEMNQSSGSAGAMAKSGINYTVTFPTVSFSNLTLDNGFYSARSITADTAKLKFSILDPSVPSTAEGTYQKINFNNISWAQQPNIADAPDKPVSRYYPIFDALTDVSFDSASVGEMTLNQTIGNEGVSLLMTYGATTMGKAVRGNFQDMFIAGMNVVIQTAGEGTDNNVSFSIGEMTLSNYDYRALVQNFKPGSIAVSSDEPYKTVIGEMVFNDFKVSADGGNFSMDKLAVRDMGVRPSRFPVLSAVDSLVVQATSGGGDPDPKELIKLIGGIYGALRLGEFELSGLKFSIPNEAQGKMDLYRIADLSANGLGEFSLKGMNGTGPKGEYVNLDVLSILDVKFPALEALMNLEEAGKNNDILAIMKAIPTIGKYTLKGIEARIPQAGSFSMAESTVEMSDFIGPIPTKVNVLVTDASMPVKQLDREPRQIFSAMGFEKITVSYALTMAWSEAANVLSMFSSTELEDGGVVEAEASVGGIPRSVFENPMTAQTLIALLTVNGAKIMFDDRSIVDKALKLFAAQQGVDAETLKAQGLGMLPFALQMLNKPVFVNELSATLKTFLDSGGTITATATPAAPVSIIQLMGVGSSAPGALIDLLKVKVTAE